MDIVNFQCNGCGKCCSESPRMHFFEMLELSDTFIFQTTHNTVLSTTKNLLDKKLLEHYGILGHTIMLPELEASMFYFIDFKPLELISQNYCSKLTSEGKCSIFASRPSLCRLAPISPYLDEEDQNRTIKIFKSNSDINYWKCDFKNNKNTIYKDLQIVKYQDNEMYINYINSIRQINDMFMDTLSIDQNKKNEHLKKLFDFNKKNNTMIADLIQILKIALLNALLSKDYVEKIIKNQINLIKKQIEFSTTNKLKENLPIVKIYKEFLQNYESSLESSFFDIDTENFKII